MVTVQYILFINLIQPEQTKWSRGTQYIMVSSFGVTVLALEENAPLQLAFSLQNKKHEPHMGSNTTLWPSRLFSWIFDTFYNVRICSSFLYRLLVKYIVWQSFKAGPRYWQTFWPGMLIYGVGTCIVFANVSKHGRGKVLWRTLPVAALKSRELNYASSTGLKTRERTEHEQGLATRILFWDGRWADTNA